MSPRDIKRNVLFGVQNGIDPTSRNEALILVGVATTIPSSHPVEKTSRIYFAFLPRLDYLCVCSIGSVTIQFVVVVVPFLILANDDRI